MKRRIFYVTGTRADFGLMRSTLLQIHRSERSELEILVTGMHLDSAYGETISEVEQTGIPYRVVESSKEDGSRWKMLDAMAEQMQGFGQLFAQSRPDILLVLGDRGEMLAAAIAALHFNIPVAHVHGGELSGTIDEPIRHAISKLSHIHFTSTQGAAERLSKMGENKQNIFVSGAPGLDDIVSQTLPSEEEFRHALSLPHSSSIAALLFHPVVQDAEDAGKQMETLLSAIPESLDVVLLKPNADAGGNLIEDAIENFLTKREHAQRCRVVTHLPRNMYLALIKYSCVLVGNSSSGIIEAASFNTWVINVGSRQNARERNNNVVDVPVEQLAIKRAFEKVISQPPPECINVYGNGTAGRMITKVLEQANIGSGITNKVNSY